MLDGRLQHPESARDMSCQNGRIGQYEGRYGLKEGDIAGGCEKRVQTGRYEEKIQRSDGNLQDGNARRRQLKRPAPEVEARPDERGDRHISHRQQN